MLEIIKDSFKITNKYIILATPLILFSLFSGIYLLFSASGNAINILFAFVLFFFMLGAFLSGWFFMIKKCVSNPEGEDVTALIKEFPAGVGEYFLSVCGFVIISCVVGLTLVSLSYIAGIKFIGDISETYKALINASVSADALKAFLTTLPYDKLVKLGEWNLLVFITAFVSYFLLIFYSPALFFKTKNPFKALFISIKDLFGRRFFKNLLLFIIISSIYFIVSIIENLAGKNIFAHFVLTLLNLYYVVFAAVCIYNYYYKNFIQIGGSVDKLV